jgi:hypothetical protein
MVDAEVTSIAREAGWPYDVAPTTASLAQATDRFAMAFAQRLVEATTTRALVPQSA